MTKRLIEAADGARCVKVTTHIVDVSDEQQFLKFRDEVAEQMDTDHIHLLINNAGVTGGASMIETAREEWERTFGICWGGVYLGVRTFLPVLIKASTASSSTCRASTDSGPRLDRWSRTRLTARRSSRSRVLQKRSSPISG
jgi:NAD(P)-dependent dehydrogenase (short-subunit alcohol dehydrogenase family)